MIAAKSPPFRSLPAVLSQKAIVPLVELKSAWGGMTIWLPGKAAVNCMTPLRAATVPAHVGSTFVPGCFEPWALSTITSFTGAASKLYRAMRLCANDGRGLIVRIAGVLVSTPKEALLAVTV